MGNGRELVTLHMFQFSHRSHHVPSGWMVCISGNNRLGGRKMVALFGLCGFTMWDIIHGDAHHNRQEVRFKVWTMNVVIIGQIFISMLSWQGQTSLNSGRQAVEVTETYSSGVVQLYDHAFWPFGIRRCVFVWPYASAFELRGMCIPTGLCTLAMGSRCTSQVI